MEGTYNSGGGGFNFGDVNNSLMVNGQNTGTQTNNMHQSANKEADKEAMKEAMEKRKNKTECDEKNPCCEKGNDFCVSICNGKIFFTNT